MAATPPGKQGRPPTDYRAMRRKHERRSVAAAIAILVVGGGVLIGLFFGLVEMLVALPWLMLGAAGILGLYLLVVWLEKWADR